MEKSRLTILIIFALTLVGITTFYFMRVWEESQTRFRAGPDSQRHCSDAFLTDAERMDDSPQVPIVRTTDPLLSGGHPAISPHCFWRISERASKQILRIFATPSCRGRKVSVRTARRDSRMPQIIPKPLLLPLPDDAAQQGNSSGMHDSHAAQVFKMASGPSSL